MAGIPRSDMKKTFAPDGAGIPVGAIVGTWTRWIVFVRVSVGSYFRPLSGFRR